MSRTQKQVAWGTIISALVAAGAVAVFISRSTAQAEVAPVKERVTAVETEQRALHDTLNEMRKDTKCLLKLHMSPPQRCE